MEPRMNSGQICSHCGDVLALMDEIFLLQVVYATIAEGNRGYFILRGHDGEYAYEPQFFHFACWEEVWEDLCDELEAAGAVIPNKPDDRTCCSLCASPTGLQAPLAVYTIGELRRSARSPNGQYCAYFDSSGDPEILCWGCTYILNEDVFEMWENMNTSQEAG